MLGSVLDTWNGSRFNDGCSMLQKAMAMGRQKVQGHERAVFQQLEKLQAQEPARTTSSLPAKTGQTPAEAPHSASPPRIRSPEAQAVKVEPEATTDEYWGNNQSNQVQLDTNVFFLVVSYNAKQAAHHRWSWRSDVGTEYARHRNLR